MAVLLDATLPAQAAAGAQINIAVGEIPLDGQYFGTNSRLQRVRVVSPSAVNGAVTNNATLNVVQFRAGVSLGTIATITLAAGVNLAANAGVDLPVTGGACQLGDTFAVQMIQNGAGLALPAGIAVLVEVV